MEMEFMTGLFGGVTALAILSPLLSAAVIVIIGAIIIKLAIKLVGRTLVKLNVDEALHTFVKNVVKVILWIVVIVTALGKLGIPTTTFVTVIGACGAAIALALKDSLGNVAGGILILFNKPFRKGDFIELGGISGSVDKIDLLVTTLKTPDNKVVSVPNGSISTGVLTNYSREAIRRVDCTFSIGYDCSIGKAKDVLASVMESNEKILKTPAPNIVVAAHSDSSIDLSCRAWCSGDDYWDVFFFMQENVKLAFDEAGISIPFPQMDVHVVK